MTSSAKFTVTPTHVEGVLVIEPKVLGDASSWFMESFNARDLSAAIGSDIKFVQDNQSFSKQWTLRGMHFQAEHPQGKLVRVLQGTVFDVVVDVRKNSTTYGKWFGVDLGAKNHKQLWVSPGLAHGFLVISPTAEILYKTTDYYHPQSEVCLAWNDSDVGIKWPLPIGIEPLLSAKDGQGLSLKLLPG
ncbi:dTDP-4-dehydrorhamnose 3,5-epimerase [Polynucleobacter sphagniphilus]|uniref:dTDP-4-dehydrorhamnose 3,5-epimerase n=1 Tax=Polynucleobacter sphagniphilus TaxID=1743169 RepID=UPI002406A5F2|nr:dTDP-4-dehydrorhamnose 3,5-epimerase [Polynucleobacter sphagniphilus]MDF9787830.1 dTDP-4-dehydrorhamnose 3,5-epimerase [Polynucleobacter sphagniphilus]